MLEQLLENLDTACLYYDGIASRCNLTCEFFTTYTVCRGYLLLSLTLFVLNSAVYVYINTSTCSSKGLLVFVPYTLLTSTVHINYLLLTPSNNSHYTIFEVLMYATFGYHSLWSIVLLANTVNRNYLLPTAICNYHFPYPISAAMLYATFGCCVTRFITPLASTVSSNYLMSIALFIFSLLTICSP
jgi:hypothetical protein